MHIHLDPLGGIAGDMFVAALLDVRPELADDTIRAVRGAGLGDHVRLEHSVYNDDVLTGSRFVVTCRIPDVGSSDSHDHVHWCHLRHQLGEAALSPGVRDRAIAIFSSLAEAEAGIHGVSTENATFHEVGAWDSIADIVAAAFLIETIGAESWSTGSLPLGYGVVRCAHGDLPLPAPATMRLLEGFVFHDDGRPGERVTPTGAAILKNLQPKSGPDRTPRRLSSTGYGFGLRRLEGMSNVLRASVYEPTSIGSGPDDHVGVISFEIDDQTAEDLAIGVEHLRDRDDVLDILQMPAFGKKGRVVTALRLLVRADAVEQVIEACFQETTTLGIRWSIENRAILDRHMTRTDSGARVKLATRPDGRLTAKAESDDLSDLPSHRVRQERRVASETTARLGDSLEHEE